MGGKQAKISSTNSGFNNCDENQKTNLVKRKISSTSSSSFSLKWRLSNSHVTESNPQLNGALVAANKYNQKKLNKSTVNLASQPEFYNSNNKLTSPFKRFGISPRFKRKIVEAISKTARNETKQTLFASNKLYNVFQSQLNLLQSLDLSNKYLSRQQTLLSVSLERNSFRYQSRRKYKTQSLSNPYRHGNTNYPVYIHEALFLPEFSVKGKVTEADFEIIDVISRGAFGHVIKVKQKDDDKLYAMKIMWKSQVIRDRALQQVKDEVTIAASCNDNPFVVKTWFYWQSKRFLYIITSFIENGELLSLWLKVHHFPERMVCIYIAEMSLVLDYLHKKGIIYRDIKMENILLDQNGHVQLIDFGLSKWLKLGEKTSTICGTIQYMGPEVLSVEPYTHAVDWWSLGILMYALLTGEYPINAAKDHIQMSDRVQKHQFELDTNKYSINACELIKKLLCKNSNKRLKTLNELKNEKFFSYEVKKFYQSCNDLNVDYWDSNTIIKYYTPFQVLFEELNNLKALKQQSLRINQPIEMHDECYDNNSHNSDSLFKSENNIYQKTGVVNENFNGF